MILKITLIGLLAGVVGTGIGGVIASIFRKKVDKYLSFCMGLSGGIMLAIVVFDLMKEALEISGVKMTVLFTFIGVLFTMFIKDKLDSTGNMKSGYLIFISILLHNFPEGLAIGSSFISEQSLGITLAIVIGLHNIPEGLATALSLVGTKVPVKKIILLTIIAGIPMGVGSFFGAYLAGSFESLIGLFLSLASGTMLFVVLDEIIPKSKSLYSIIGFLIGTIIVYCV